jgi:uncharacterized protein YqgC (DUF456 family)
MFHQWIALIIFMLFSLVGIILTIAGIGGTFLIAIGAGIYNLLTWSMAISLNALIWVTGLAIIGELLEWIITMIGMKAGGTSKNALIGTIAGAVAGGMLLSAIPIIGTIIGIVLGAIIGAYLSELMHTQNPAKAWKAAKTALLGRALVSLSKFLLAIIQLAIIFKEIF